MMQEIEIQRLREQVAQMKEEIEAIRQDVYDAESADADDNAGVMVPAPPKPKVEPEAPWYAPRRASGAMNWMYDIAQAHAIIRNFGWAMVDGAKFAGFVGGAAWSAGKIAKNNPKATAALLVAAAAVGTVERLTRYEDEEGETHHKCAIM